MATRFGNKIQTTLLVGSVLVISSCASIKTGDSNTRAETIADDTTRTTIQKGKFENPPEMQLSSVNSNAESGNSVSETASLKAQTSTTNITRINQKEASVNVRHAPSAKSRSLAVLKAGQSIEVLETKDNWVKITWQKGDAVKQGWLKKAFVEGQ